MPVAELLLTIKIARIKVNLIYTSKAEYSQSVNVPRRLSVPRSVILSGNNQSAGFFASTVHYKLIEINPLAKAGQINFSAARQT